MAGQTTGMVVDLVVDRFISGSPKRISREAPVLILRYEGEHATPGGGANAVANVKALGGTPLTVGIVGDDESGRTLTHELTSRGVSCSGIEVRRGFRTPTKTRLLAGASYAVRQQVARWDVEDYLELSPAALSSLLAGLGSLTPGVGRDARTVVVLSDYGYGAVPPLISSLLRERFGNSVYLICDSRYRLAGFVGLDAATPNQEEAEALLGAALPDEPEALAKAGWQIAERLGVEVLLITRGSHGMAVFARSPTGQRNTALIPVHGTDQVADVTGAGDTVIGAFALAMASGATAVEAALVANYAGGIVVQKMGTATCSPSELCAAINADRALLERVRWVE